MPGKPGAAATQLPANLRIVERVPSRADAKETVLVCPWLKGLPPDSALWVSALPIHDANAFIDDDARITAPAAMRARLYFGVFALDRLRSTDHLLAALRAKGLRRLVNLPSVSFFDASTARTFNMLDFSIEQEIAFLLRAKRAGFSVALCARRGTENADADEFDFVLVHDGPGARMEVVFPGA
jgi:predicted TIM-barrel enzyme